LKRQTSDDKVYQPQEESPENLSTLDIDDDVSPPSSDVLNSPRSVLQCVEDLWDDSPIVDESILSAIETSLGEPTTTTAEEKDQLTSTPQETDQRQLTTQSSTLQFLKDVTINLTQEQT